VGHGRDHVSIETGITVLTRRALGLLAAWAVWSVALLLFLTGSAAPGVGTLAGFFYNNSGRFSGMVAPVQWGVEDDSYSR